MAATETKRNHQDKQDFYFCNSKSFTKNRGEIHRRRSLHAISFPFVPLTTQNALEFVYHLRMFLRQVLPFA